MEREREREGEIALADWGALKGDTRTDNLAIGGMIRDRNRPDTRSRHEHALQGCFLFGGTSKGGR